MNQLVNNIKRGPLANVIALHDFNSVEVNVKSWFSYVIEWFRVNGLEPTRIGLTGAPYKGTKTIAFRNGLKRLEENDYKEVEGISLYATPPDHSTDMFDGIFILEYSGSNRGDFILCWDNQIAPFSKEYCQKLLIDLYPFIKPKYGYAFQRLFTQGPSFYPMGIINSEKKLEQEERDKISEWYRSFQHPAGSYVIGDLRDVYPLNILSEAHIGRIVNGHPFKDWINATPQRGKLDQITDTLWTWWVEPDHISAVREALVPSGMILCL